MSYEGRLTTIDTTITNLESLEPFTVSAAFAQLRATQIVWEDEWVSAGNILPIPVNQELYFFGVLGNKIEGEFRVLPDRFNLLSRHKTEGYELRDIAGWEDNSHLLVYILRGEVGDFAGQVHGPARMYMDGSLEQLAFAGFAPDGLLGYDRDNGHLWYWEGADVKYIDVVSEAITTVLATTTTLPEWRFFVILPDGSGDAYFGASVAADPNPSLYFWDESAGTATRVATTFDPSTGAVNPNRPMAVTTSYVYLSETDSRAGFNGNLLHQIERSGHTYDDTVDLPSSISEEIHVIPFDQDYANDTLDFAVSHVRGVSPSTWTRYFRWSGIAMTEVGDLPYKEFLDILRDNVNDSHMDYFVRRRFYYDDSFVVDGGDEKHYHSLSGAILSPDSDKYLLHDQGFRTWSDTNSPDIFIYSNRSTDKVYRISERDQQVNDVITYRQGTISNNPVSFSPTSDGAINGHGLIEIVLEAKVDTAGDVAYGGHLSGELGILEGSSSVALRHVQDLTSPFQNLLGGEIYTDGNIVQIFIIVRDSKEDMEITFSRRGIRTADSSHVVLYSQVAGQTGFTTLIPLIGSEKNRYVVRVWRASAERPTAGDGYDPFMD